LNDLGFEAISFGTIEYTNLKIYKVYIHVCVRIDVIEQLKEHFIKFFDERSNSATQPATSIAVRS